MTSRRYPSRTFQRALVFSVAAHLTLLFLIAASPRFPGLDRKGMIHYIPLNLGGFPGGGGGGGRGQETQAVPTEIKKESLRDLTTLQKLREEPKSNLRYPVDKPERDKKSKTEKKAAVSQPQAEAKSRAGQASAKSSTGSGFGSGLRIGGSGSGEGSGFGTGYSSQIGLSDFPYTYYLQIIIDRVSSNWFTSLVDPGVRGEFQSVVYFRIFRNGQISEVKVQESSGLRSLDLSAIRAVQRSAPLPPLPRDYNQEYLGIYLIFEHSK